MIPANRDAETMIREDAKNCIHVRLSKTNYDPNNPRNQNTRSVVQSFSIKEFEDMEAKKFGTNAFNWVSVSGWDDAFVIHDGRLELQEKKIEKTKDEVDLQTAIKQAVKKEARKVNVRKNLLGNTAK